MVFSNVCFLVFLDRVQELYKKNAYNQKQAERYEEYYLKLKVSTFHYMFNVVDYLYLDFLLSRTFLYLEQRSQSFGRLHSSFNFLYLKLFSMSNKFFGPLGVRDRESALYLQQICATSNLGIAS